MTLKEWTLSLGLVIHQDDLIKNALVHSSFVNESKESIQDNERLEYIGDAVLQLWTARFLYLQEPILNEGQMTLLRAQLVCEEALASFGRQIGLNDHLILGVGEIKSGGQERDSIIADAFEAFMGALFLDGNLDNVQLIFEQTIAKHYATLNPLDGMDYKTKLQEFMQSDTRKTVTYEVVSSTGPSNNPVFESIVMLDTIVLGRGKGNSKKKSQQAAARNALEKMVK